MTNSSIQTPIGPLTIVAGPEGIRQLRFGARAGVGEPSETVEAAAVQLREYFAGERRSFDLPLDLVGTAFQRQVWSALREIPYGETTTYGTLARRFWADPVEARLHARAVGAAVGATPVPIVVPCHRVLGADGSLTGYGGGLPTKRALLSLEATTEQLTLV